MTSASLAAFRGVGLVLAFAIQIAWLFQPVPALVKILPASLLVLSIARPPAGLVVVAGMGPMADAISFWAQSPIAGIRLLEQLVLAVVSGAGLRWWRSPSGSRLGAPATLLAASAAASFVAVEPALLLPLVPDMSVSDQVRALLQRGDYFVRSSVWDPLFFAVLTIEGLALAVTAERILRRHPEAAEGTVRMAVVGQAGVAALNIEQVIGAAIRGGDAWRALPRIVRDLRVSLFYDLNAAASVFVLHLFGGVGLLKRGGRSSWVIVPLLVLIAFALWMAGSRVALAALAVTCLGVLILAALGRRGAGRGAAVAAIGALVALVVLGVMLYPSARSSSLGPTVATRRIMAETSFNMWRSAPIFGVGVGRYYEESGRFGAEALKTEVGFHPKENAHNYFLQVLSTEGLVGLAALLLVLGVGIVPAWRAERLGSVSLRRWLLAGVAACLLTWLTGHPQLVPQAAFAFWLIFGVLAGLAPSPVRPSWRTPIALAAVLLLATAPFRAAYAVRHTDLEHVAVGLSLWQPEIDGLRYRQAGLSFALYLPADGRSVDLPLRRAPGAPDPLVVTITEGGRKLYEPIVSGDAWQQIRVQLPKSNRRFARVEFVVSGVAAASLPSPVLYVGKTQPR